MTAQTPKSRSSFRLVGQIISGLVGGTLVLLAILSVIGGMLQGPWGMGVIGVFYVLSGLVLIPPVVHQLRKPLGGLKSIFVPPILAGGLFIAGSVLGSLTMIGEWSIDPAGAPRSIAEKSAGERKITRTATLTRTEKLAEVERLIEEGTPESTTGAMAIMMRTFGPRTINSDPELTAVHERAKAAADVALAAHQAENYTLRAQGPWLDAVRAIPTSTPTAAPDVWQRIEAFEEAARQIEEGEKFAGNAAAEAARVRLRQTVSERQRIVFPVLRRGYGAILRQVLWEQDTEVIVQGSGAKTLRFIAGMFAANRNIASAQTGARPNAEKLRFNRTQYEWYRGSEYSYYAMTVPSDGTVGYWQGGQFVVVD